MNSDHGYPDPRTSLNEEFFKDLGHDMILTDDNIKTPLLIKYPKCPKGIKLDNVVGHTDIIPTIFDILEIPLSKPHDNHPFRGKSLLNIIENNEEDMRIIRSDTRLLMDVGKITSYRSSSYKFVYYKDDDSKQLFNIKKDTLEINNLYDSKDSRLEKIKRIFLEYNQRYDDKLSEFHMISLKKNFSKSFNKIMSNVKASKLELLLIKLKLSYFLLQKNLRYHLLKILLQKTLHYFRHLNLQQLWKN